MSGATWNLGRTYESSHISKNDGNGIMMSDESMPYNGNITFCDELTECPSRCITAAFTGIAVQE